MGIFKDSINLRPLYAFFVTLGFKYGKRSGPGGEEGYTKTIHHNENEILWITVNTKEGKVYLYNEWDCGGELWKRILDIPGSALENRDNFIEWLDERIGE